MAEASFYQIFTEVPPSYMERLFDFIHRKYLLPQKERFTGFLSEASGGFPILSYVVLDAQKNPVIRVEGKGTSPIELKVSPIAESVSETIRDKAKQDFVIAVQLFEERARKATLYFAWREGEEIVPEELKKQEKPFNRLFLETQILLFVLFIVVGMAVFTLLTFFYPEAYSIAPLILVAAQFVLVFYSAKFIARTADWHITEDNPIIHLLDYHLPLTERDDFQQTHSREELLTIKKEIYDEILAKRGNIDCEAAGRVFARHGVACQPENLTAKKVDVYALVKTIAQKFNFQIPRIVVSNTMVPNAAAAGPSPSRGVVLITTGLLVQLEEEEVISVLGHEFGHLKGRDPLLLYGLI